MRLYNKKTIGFNELGERFKALGLKIDRSALAELNNIRNRRYRFGASQSLHKTLTTDRCAPSALMRQIGWVEGGRILAHSG